MSQITIHDILAQFCDEALHTTGVTLSGQDESHFVKIHDATFIKGKKRLYMTATPRLYGDDAKTKAAEANADLCSMDDPAMFGEELHRLGFGQAVQIKVPYDYQTRTKSNMLARSRVAGLKSPLEKIKKQPYFHKL